MQESRRAGAHFPAASEPVRAGAPRCVLVVFAALAALLCLLPSVGMIWAPTTETTENRELASVPALIEDEALNVDYLTEWGTYFEDRFAYRNTLVSLNAALRAKLLQTSPVDSVVVGSSGWLYYAGTLSDYCGWGVLSERAVENIAYNLSLMQSYCEAQGASFTVAIAPNKNSLYGDHMPYYYVAGETRSLDALEPALTVRGVAHADLYEGFASQEEELYYLRDSHWNTKGALLAYTLIEGSLDHDATLADELEPERVDDYVGDLNSMLYPEGAEPEGDYSYDDQLSWSMDEGEDVEDSWIETTSTAQGEGTLLMFRDSFANNILQFFASSYGSAYFSKLVPYDLTRVSELGADTVVIERAERHLSDLNETPAIMPAPRITLTGVDVPEGAELSGDGVSLEQDGSFTVVSGELPEDCRSAETEIFVGVERAGELQWYAPFRVAGEESDYGYRAYLTESALEGATRVVIAAGEGSALGCVQSLAISDS